MSKIALTMPKIKIKVRIDSQSSIQIQSENTKYISKIGFKEN